MEKTISPEERIKRAEEIYYRRRTKNGDIRMPSSQVMEKSENRQFSLYKKMILQILICILIYLIFSLIKDANYLFSEEVISRAKEFLNTDINFSAISEQIGKFWQENQEKFGFLKQEETQNEIQNQESENKNEQKENEQTTSEENKQTENKLNEASQSNSVGIGGEVTNKEEVVQTSSQSSVQKTQMQIDAEYIKKNFNMQLPVKGGITSRYGKREPTEIVSENHQGIDIGVVVGTTVVAAMEGKVSLVSKEGGYGTHVKIVNKDITTIYAHCSKILVKEGESVKKGQKIALSGNTGNTTGPHLHFEIRRQERSIDPELILKWT
ncbi:MAG: M23 family metallopeptidase [Clostridia bacterium]|nr:M23 family metallopeptidase [Clostridia bacterium]